MHRPPRLQHPGDRPGHVRPVALHKVAPIDKTHILHDLPLPHVRHRPVPAAARHAAPGQVVEVAVLVVQARVADADQLPFPRQAELPKRLRVRCLVAALVLERVYEERLNRADRSYLSGERSGLDQAFPSLFPSISTIRPRTHLNDPGGHLVLRAVARPHLHRQHLGVRRHKRHQPHQARMSIFLFFFFFFFLLLCLAAAATGAACEAAEAGEHHVRLGLIQELDTLEAAAPAVVWGRVGKGGK
jgi:hypothetical protein